MTLADSTDSMTFDLLEVPIADKDIEGAVDNTLVNGNVFTDYLWLKKQWTQKWALMCDDEYAQLRGFYTRQWENAEAPTYRLFYGNNVTEDVMRNGSYITENIDAPLGAEMSLTQLDGNATQTTYSGKNLIDFDTATLYTSASVDSTRQGNGFKSTIQASTSFTALATYYNSGMTIPAGTYTVSFEARCQNSNSLLLNIQGYIIGQRGDLKDASGNTASEAYRTLNSTWKKFSFTITTSSAQTFGAPNALHLYFLAPSGSQVFELQNPMLESGSTATDYEIFTGGTASPNPSYPQPISTVTGEQTVGVVGKNLASLETTGSIVGGVSFSIVDGIIHLSGTTEANKNFFFDSFRTNSGSATFWIEVTGYTDASGNSSMILQQSDDNSSWANLIEISMLSSVNKVRPVTLDSSKYYRIRWYVNSNTFTNATIKVQLEYGSTKTSFEQYQSQSYTIDLGSIELAGVGEIQADGLPKYRDSFKHDTETGKWYIEKQVGKVVLDGSESWGTLGSSGYTFRKAQEDALLNGAGGTIAPIMSDNYTPATYYATYDGTVDYGIALAPNSGRIAIANKDITTVADFQTWLSTHNTTVYYALATPTTTEITDDTLLSQLNFIANLYGGVNHISLVPSAGAQGTMEVKIHKIYEQETEIYPQTAVRLTLTDDGIINPCGCRRNVQIKMRETIQ